MFHSVSRTKSIIFKKICIKKNFRPISPKLVKMFHGVPQQDGTVTRSLMEDSRLANLQNVAPSLWIILWKILWNVLKCEQKNFARILSTWQTEKCFTVFHTFCEYVDKNSKKSSLLDIVNIIGIKCFTAFHNSMNELFCAKANNNIMGVKGLDT